MESKQRIAALALVSIVLWPAMTCAQIQTADQQKCITALNAAGAKVAKLQGKVNKKCLKDAGSGALPGTVQECLDAHASGGLSNSFNKAVGTTVSDHSAKCGGPLPDFAYSNASMVNVAAERHEQALVRDLFGPDLDAAVVSCAADKLACKCQRAVVTKTEALVAKAMSTFLKCKKPILMSATSSADVRNCLADPLTSSSVAGALDPAQTLNKLVVKLGNTIAKTCDTPGVTTGAFPGKCSGFTGDNLRDCVTRQAKCRLCQSIYDMDNLAALHGQGVSCDTFDDGGVNLTCDGRTTVDSGSEFLYSSIAVPADGIPVLGYYDSLNGDLKVAKCADYACSYLSTITTVDDVGDVGSYASLAIAADGFPVISYFDQSNGDLKVAKCSDAYCQFPTISTVDAVGVVGSHTSIAVPADGLPVISYLDATTTDLKVAKCADAQCSSASSIVVLDPLPSGGSWTSIAVPSDGLPVVVWSFGTVMVAKCGNATCSAGNTITAVANGANWQSLFIPSDGKPLIAQQSPFGGLEVVKCGDSACTAGNVATLVDPSAIGPYPSVFVSPADGLPIIAYPVTSPQQVLSVAKCTDAACASPANITSIEPIALTGGYPSVYVPAWDGRPVISYSPGAPSNTLKVLKCANASCS